MSRERCIFCHREKATDADWEANGNLPSDREDQEAECLGLNKLCWEPESDHCANAALESGRPTTLGEALEALDRATQPDLLQAIEGEIERAKRRADRSTEVEAKCLAEGDVETATRCHVRKLEREETADRLTAILNQHRAGGERS